MHKNKGKEDFGMGFAEFIEVLVWDYMWGTPMVVFILGVGCYITIRSGCFQIFNFKTSMKHALSSIFGKKDKENKKAGVLSPLEAMSAALGATVGVGNIGGVATALATGGPGAIFWMWIAGLFGMVIKMAEITLAVHYRSKDKNNEAYGGPNYYIKKGLGIEKNHTKLYKVLGVLFSVSFMMGYFLNIQAYTVSEAMASTFSIGMIPVAIVFTILLYIMISGGMRSVGKWALRIVPFMCLFYLLSGLYIVLINFTEIPAAFALIFQSAFTPSAAFGGFAGATMSQAIKVGMARSVFSNEAGWGSAPMIHASAKVDHPVQQGMMGVFEVFVDTFIICTITCLTIMVTGQWSSGLDGASLTLSAYEMGIGYAGRVILALGVFIFGITTASGLYAQTEVIVRYLVGESKLKDRILAIYKWTYPIPSLALVLFTVLNGYDGVTVWLISDAGTAVPIFVNVLVLFLLTPKFVELIKDYKARYMGIGEVDPNTKVFYED